MQATSPIRALVLTSSFVCNFHVTSPDDGVLAVIHNISIGGRGGGGAGEGD